MNSIIDKLLDDVRELEGTATSQELNSKRFSEIGNRTRQFPNKPGAGSC